MEAKVIKLAATQLLQPITIITNLSIRTEVFPNKWKIGKVIPLFKGKRLSRTNPASYMPITMLPAISKILEKSCPRTITRPKWVRYSCLIPKTCDEVDVEDLVNAALQMHNIFGLKGVVTCRTTYTQQTNQRICDLDVTEALAEMFESCDRVLEGPVGLLVFKLKPDSKDRIPVSPSCDGDTDSPVPKTKILPSIESDLLEGESDGVKVDDPNLLDSSINNTNSPLSVSDTESMSLKLGCQMSIESPPDWSKEVDDVPAEGGDRACPTIIGIRLQMLTAFQLNNKFLL